MLEVALVPLWAQSCVLVPCATAALHLSGSNAAIVFWLQLPTLQVMAVQAWELWDSPARAPGSVDPPVCPSCRCQGRLPVLWRGRVKPSECCWFVLQATIIFCLLHTL